MKVLHVTESFNGGVHEAILRITLQTPSFQHYILGSPHIEDPISDNSRFNVDVTFSNWNGNMIFRISQLRKYVKSNQPDIIHLHSSRAGFIGRIFLPMKSKIIYSPHAFGFQKLDTSKIVQKLIKFVEQLLQLRPSTNLAFWPIEYILFKEFRYVNRTYFSDILLHLFEDKKMENKLKDLQSIRVANIGRLAPQKDPDFFIDTVKFIRQEIDVVAFWIGGGQRFDITKFKQNRIEFIEWLKREDLEKFMTNIDLLIISSAWESGPMTLFESLSLGVPVAIRTTASSTSFGLGNGITTKELAISCIEIIRSDRKTLVNSQKERIANSMKNYQITRLEEIYLNVACGRKFL